ncbi:hypothetical protein PINS_up001647 [Pythium insidiosum]|nr:hypothetical protein PINS_up001647 [Pythium insidiosum]
MSRGFDDMNRLFCIFEADHNIDALAFSADQGTGYMTLHYDVLKEVISPDGAHWHMGSALQLLHCPWISKIEAVQQEGPTISWSSAVRGPVGNGECDGEQMPFGVNESSSEPTDVAAVLVMADQYLIDVEAFSHHEFSQVQPLEKCASGEKHWVVFLPGEYITHVEIRAMAWIDGLRIHTNLRSTRWFGGFGGCMHQLKPPSGHQIHGFFGTYGECYVGQLGVYCSPIPSGSRSTAPQLQLFALPSDIVTTEVLGGRQGSDVFSFRELPIAAIAVTCNEESIMGLRVVSIAEHSTAVTKTDGCSVYGPHDHVFDLLPGEYLSGISARCDRAIESICFLTNLRQSPWYGNKRCKLKAQTIHCPPNHLVCGVFGSTSDKLNTLGLYTGPIIYDDGTKLGPVGRGEYDGVQRSFTTCNGSDARDIGAVEICASDYLYGIKTLGRDELAGVRDVGGTSAANAELFSLEADEYITQIEVRAMCWVDGIRIHTNYRQSDWFGGNGGELHVLTAPRGSRIHGFFGTSGNRYVGRIGAFVSPLPVEAPSVSKTSRSSPSYFSLLGYHSVPPQDQRPVRGFIVVVQDQKLQLVRSFATLDDKARVIEELTQFASAFTNDTQMSSFTFEHGEHLIQISASSESAAPGRSIVGVCFHTTMRSSSWFGTFVDGRDLHFVAAPANSVISSIEAAVGLSSVLDFTGAFTPLDHVQGPTSPSTATSAFSTITEDIGAYDIRIDSASPSRGIDVVFVQHRPSSEYLDHYAFRWNSPTSLPRPSTWCLPQRLLEHFVDASDKTHALTTEYRIGAIDKSGAMAKAAGPPDFVMLGASSSIS